MPRFLGNLENLSIYNPCPSDTNMTYTSFVEHNRNEGSSLDRHFRNSVHCHSLTGSESNPPFIIDDVHLRLRPSVTVVLSRIL
jgi:hypothetical protein